MIREQIKTGWGFGTGLDILVLVPWIIQLACIPIAIAAAVYFILAFLKKASKKILIANIVLFSVLALQSLIINLFIWY